MAKNPSKSADRTREAKIAEQRLIERVAVEGRIKGLAWDEICQILDQKHSTVCSPIKAQILCEKSLARVPVTGANHLRALESHRFDIIVRDFLAVVLDKEARIYDKAKAASILLKVSSQRCQMLGLNMQPVFLTPTTQAAEDVGRFLGEFVAINKSTPEDELPIASESVSIDRQETWHDKESMLQ